MSKWLRSGFTLALMSCLAACSLPEAAWDIPFVRSVMPSETSVSMPPSSEAEDAVHQPHATVTSLPQQTTENCNVAAAGIPFDVSIPDGTKMKPAESFTKTWRLINAGTCAWSNEYSVVWFFGDDIGVSRVKHIRQEVPPGASIDLSVDMFAPKQPGIYHSYWKLRNSDGELFGIGPNGRAPFWVSIEVIDLSTPTMIVMPTATAVESVLSSAEVTLQVDEAVDLDDNGSGEHADEDLFFVEDEEMNLQIETRNGARLSNLSSRAPTFEDCQASIYDTDVIYLQESVNTIFFCFTTSQEVPGYGQVSDIDLDEKTVRISYQTWKIP